MIELKFRQALMNKDGEFLRWHYWGFLTTDMFTGVVSVKMPNYQYTGLLDKRGKEIYEGDIILGAYDGDPNFYVSWNEQEGAWYLTEPSTNLFAYMVSDYIYDKREVIGNIYENFDLLEEK